MNSEQKAPPVDVFIDSGAFSAYTQKTIIDISEYIEFLCRYKKYVSVYANLDVIGDPVATLKNQHTMEASGLTPLPVFHFGEPLKYLKHYTSNYKYIALGGMVGRGTGVLCRWLDGIWCEYLLDGDGLPKVQIHGFGLTSIPLLLRYPWYSVDSTSWILISRMGGIIVPRHTRGAPDYTRPWILPISDRGNADGKKNKHYTTLRSAERVFIEEYINNTGFCVGSSEYRTVECKQYKLKDNEYWVHRSVGRLGVVLQPGLCNNYRHRDQFNIRFYESLEEQLPQYPHKARVRKVGLI